MSPARAGLAMVLALAIPAVSQAQGLTIDHKQVGCIVAGKYARLNACFIPATDVVKPRVNFRMVEQAASYYVEMKSDMPCHVTFLPRAKKELIGKEIELWVEGMDRSFNPARTPEYKVMIVGSEAECRKDLPVAPWVSRASVTVFPALGPGFMASAAVPATVLAVTAGAAAVATGTYVATQGDNPPPPVQNTPPPPAPTPTPTPAPIPTPTPSPGTLTVDCSVSPRSGVMPLAVRFIAQASGVSGPVDYVWQFGDGTSASDRETSHTYAQAGVFNAIVTATSGGLSGQCDRNVSVSRPNEVLFRVDVTPTGSGAGNVSSNPSGVSCPSDCEHIYARDTVVTLTPTPDARSVFVGWSGACSGTGPCTLNMNADQAVTAKFDLKTFKLGVSKSGTGGGTVRSTNPPGGIDCGGDCGEAYTIGTSVSLGGTPDAASTFVSWSGDCSGPNPSVCTVIMDTDRSVNAKFDGLSSPSATLTVATSGKGLGTVTADPPPGGITCPGDCSETYSPTPITVTLRAAPNANSFFFGWTGACSGIGPCTLTLTADASVGAVFEPLQARLTLTCTDNRALRAALSPAGAVAVTPGILLCDTVPTSSQTVFNTYSAGTNLTLTAIKIPGTEFITWGGDCGSVGTTTSSPSTCNLVLPPGGATVTVFFNNTPPISLTAAPPSSDEGSQVAVAWRHQLDVPGATGQVVLNGATTVASGPGLNSARAAGRAGENRIEGRLTAAAGRAGTWRFELGGTMRLEPGSIRLLAGEPVVVTGDAVVFRLRGQPGEHVMFTFRLKR